MNAALFNQKASCPTEQQKEGGKRILSQLIEIVENAGQSIAEINSQGIFSGICVSTAGMVDCEQGKILYSGELILLIREPRSKDLGKQISCSMLRGK